MIELAIWIVAAWVVTIAAMCVLIPIIVAIAWPFVAITESWRKDISK